MLTRTLGVTVFALAGVCGVAFTQNGPPMTPISAAGPAVQVAPSIPQVPPEKVIDQLLDEVEKIRLQKAELEKREQELVQEIRKKLEKQTDRITRLGIAEAGPKPVSVRPAQAPSMPSLP